MAAPFARGIRQMTACRILPVAYTDGAMKERSRFLQTLPILIGNRDRPRPKWSEWVLQTD
jgi:hypothetical protein